MTSPSRSLHRRFTFFSSSNNWSLRKLGAASWRKLHKLTYPAAVFGAVHYLWLVKGFQIEPIIYLVLIAALIATRYWPTARARGRA